MSIAVKFYDSVPDELLRFAVIASRTNGKWVFCRHRERTSYEMPGGRREPGEDIAYTAERELREETGAKDFDIHPVCAYSVTGRTRVNTGGGESFGMLFYAEIFSFENELRNEISEILLTGNLPAELTYPMIQPLLLKKAASFALS